MGWLSVNIDFSDRPVLLIGAGQVGRRKLADLLAAGAQVTVIDPKPHPSVVELALKGDIRLDNELSEPVWEVRPWVFVAIDDPREALGYIQVCRRWGLMVNVADSLAVCDFTMPAVVSEPPFRLAVSTEGNSPALAARVAAELRHQYQGYGALTKLLGRLRPLILDSGLDLESRKRIFKALADDKSILELLVMGLTEDLLKVLKKHLETVEIPLDFPISDLLYLK